MAAPGADTVADLLAAELASLQRFHTLLGREQDILKNNQADLLIAVSEQKTALASELGQIMQRRERALSAQGHGGGRTGMDAWLASQAEPARSTFTAQWRQLLDLLNQCRAEHDINGQLISMQLARTQQALSALMLAGGKPLTYGPDGQQHIGLGSGRTLGSA